MIRLVADPADVVVHAQWNQWTAERRELVAPTLLHYEVVNGLYQYQRVGLASAEYIQRIVEAALAVPVRLVGEPDIHRSALELATEFSLRASYDAHYLALADRLGIHFYTVDARLHRRVRSKLTWVHLVGGEDES